MSAFRTPLFWIVRGIAAVTLPLGRLRNDEYRRGRLGNAAVLNLLHMPLWALMQALTELHIRVATKELNRGG